jgi:hypothetical protein
MLHRAERADGPLRARPTRRALIWASVALLVAACSDQMFADLGGRSSNWIGEVATTATTTTTTPPSPVRPTESLVWVNDEFGAPPEGAEVAEVLAEAFGRAEDNNSRFLQASRAEIATAVPEVQFPSVVPAAVSHITSQLVIEIRELSLSSDPTVAFGFWSVEPYTRSRSVGQEAVLNLSRDPEGVEVAAQGEPEDVCLRIASPDTLCGVEPIGGTQVWRLEDAEGLAHVWYIDPFRYEFDGFDDQAEELIHEVIASFRPLSEMLPAGG